MAQTVFASKPEPFKSAYVSLMSRVISDFSPFQPLDMFNESAKLAHRDSPSFRGDVIARRRKDSGPSCSPASISTALGTRFPDFTGLEFHGSYPS